MKRFTDADGSDWIVTLNTTVVKRVRSLLDVDLLDIADGKLIDRLSSDPVLLVDVIYVVVKPEADARKVTDEQFGEKMRGDAIAQATDALLDELVDFSPSPRMRSILGRLLTASRTARDRAMEVVEKRLDSGVVDREIDRAIAAAETYGDTSTDAPASVESTPGP